MTDFENSQQALQQAFLDELSTTLETVQKTLASLKSNWNVDSARQVQLLVHKLAGSGASLGFHQLSYAARNVEVALKDANLLADVQAAARTLELLDERLAELRRVTSSAHATVKLEDIELSALEQATQSMQESRAGQVIFLVEDDDLQARDLATQVGHFGYTVKSFRHPGEIGAALQAEHPAAILMDIVFPEGDTVGSEAIRALHEAHPVPVIFVAARDDALARLHAIRVGGEAYFSKPINISLLIDTLDRYTLKADPIPYRIMIVDDSTVQANFTAFHLLKAGMEVRIVNEPLTSLEVIREFGPDLILLDMYMPDCTGMELAALIRQVESHISIPIVFLSSETNREIQLEAVGLGGDDFLTKPIEPMHLVAAVSSRVERYRKLRELMLHDSLTGLLNHTATREALGHELLRAARQNLPLAYVMLDLDLFKNVNDQYGHATGDRVLKSLAQLLTKRLRHSDIVGRYGGEEFAVILPNTSGPAAAAIMDNLRSGFADLRHQAGDEEFSVTFSCGVATFPEFGSIAALSEAADQSLYLSKHQGRNRGNLAVSPQTY